MLRASLVMSGADISNSSKVPKGRSGRSEIMIRAAEALLVMVHIFCLCFCYQPAHHHVTNNEKKSHHARCSPACLSQALCDAILERCAMGSLVLWQNT